MSKQDCNKVDTLIKSLFGPTVQVTMQFHFDVPVGEDGIVWLEDPAQFPFVRCRIVNSLSRYRKMSTRTAGKVIGYSTVGQQPKATGQRYQRRIFYLTPEDLEPLCIYRQTSHLPLEGIRPLSIRAGYWGDR